MDRPLSNQPDIMSENQSRYLKAHRRHHHLISLFRLLLIVLFLGLWELAGRKQWIDVFFFSSPGSIVLYLYQMLLDYSFFTHTGITLLETVVSFLLVTILSLLAATLLWYINSLAEILEPYLVILNSLPKSALAPLLIVWLGTGTNTIIVAGISVAVFGSVISLYTGFRQADAFKVALDGSRNAETDLHAGRQQERCPVQSHPSQLSPADPEYYEGQYWTIAGGRYYR